MDGLFVSTSASQVLDFFVWAAVALNLGAVIGVERQWHHRMAGLRTNARPTG
jgi:putative Mg2+ transporter-C (MgtC) family protein